MISGVESKAAAWDKGLMSRGIQKARPILSIVIPAYNVERFIVVAVRSALAQTVDDIEVIVVDDGSSDRTGSLVRAIRDPRLRVISQKNCGLSGARNSGIRAARGKYVGFLDGDDVWMPGKAAHHLAVMEADHRIGLTFSYSIYLDEDGAETGLLLISKVQRPTLKDMLVRNHVGNGSTPVVRADVLEQGGVFDETLASCEDWELWIRLMYRAKCTISLIPKALTGYRVRGESFSQSYDTFYESAQMLWERVGKALPEEARAAKGRALGEIARIVSRKALSAGNVTIARRYMGIAIKHCPTLAFRDWRALATFAMIVVQGVIPQRWQGAALEKGERILKWFYRRYEES